MTYLNSGGQVLASVVTGGLNLGFRRGVILFQFCSSFQKENIGENFLPFFHFSVGRRVVLKSLAQLGVRSSCVAENFDPTVRTQSYLTQRSFLEPIPRCNTVFICLLYSCAIQCSFICCIVVQMLEALRRFICNYQLTPELKEGVRSWSKS